MTCKYYIGIRLHSSEMAKVNGGNTAQLNTSMSSTLGSAAMGMGIKKTQSGKSLNFFPYPNQITNSSHLNLLNHSFH